MPEACFRAVVPSGQTQVDVECTHNKLNLTWVVWQISVESSAGGDTEAEVIAVRRNGRFVSSSFIVPSAAQGPPALALGGADKLTFEFVGMSAGEEAIVTLFYKEVVSTEVDSNMWVV